ncbi:MAG: sporulation protein YqfD [Clostridia bacterium]|nr:sporulation protein YqfD [Clostridia bacterium]
MSLFGNVYRKLTIEGIMPERALLRLKRAKIPLYSIRKTDKTHLSLRVKQRDLEKVLSVFPNSEFSPYKVTDCGGVGVLGRIEKLFSRVGLLLGALLFVAITLYADRFVFKVEYVGTDVYARETRIALDKAGVKTFAPYISGKEDWICSQILALDGVEYCSIKKSGTRLIVETRLSPFASEYAQTGKMQSNYTGEVIALTALRGTPLVKVGDKVEQGQAIVDDCFSLEGGGQVRVEIIARARFSCVWESDVSAETAEEAFAKAYLEIGVNAEITEKIIEELDGAFHVKLVYTATQSMNF